MFVIPRDGFSIIDPQRNDVLPPEGRHVGSDHPTYWQRRISDGDVILVPADKVDAAKAALEKADTARARVAADALAAQKKTAEAAAAQKAAPPAVQK